MAMTREGIPRTMAVMTSGERDKASFWAIWGVGVWPNLLTMRRKE